MVFYKENSMIGSVFILGINGANVINAEGSYYVFRD
jgi:hypothetical protein